MPTSPILRPTFIHPFLFWRVPAIGSSDMCTEAGMKENKELLTYVQRFFQEYLRAHRGMSSNTVFAYRDAIKLFIIFLGQHVGREPRNLSLDHLHADAVLAFLEDIEARGNSVATRNLRLSALRTFFSYLAVQDPLRAAQCQRVAAIPLKQWSRPLIGYLEVEEVKAILGCIDQTSPLGRRDYALLSILYNTGARVQEICDLKGEDVSHSPPLVVVTGKGRKTRQVPLWPQTANLLAEYMKGHDPGEKLFLNARGAPLTRLGVYHVIKMRAKAAADTLPALAKKKIGPHTFRHTTAMHLLQSGVDLNVIKSWLGHVHVATTHAYIEIDLEMKRKALDRCTPVNDGSELNDLVRKNEDIISWLHSL
jgi:site-specific recombinase XerD